MMYCLTKRLAGLRFDGLPAHMLPKCLVIHAQNVLEPLEAVNSVSLLRMMSTYGIQSVVVINDLYALATAVARLTNGAHFIEKEY